MRFSLQASIIALLSCLPAQAQENLPAQPPEKIEILTKWVKGGLAWTPGLDLTPAGVVAPSINRQLPADAPGAAVAG